MNKIQIRASINIFDLLPVGGGREEPDASDLVRLFCARAADVRPALLLQRYEMISSAGMEPAILPALPLLTERIVSPLLNAKVAFVAGNPIGTIALCGFVAEMVALMTYEIAQDEGRVSGVTISKFEALGQQMRVKCLYKQSAISQETKAAFDVIREIRRKYLHFISADHSRVQEDALHIYKKTVWLLVNLVGQEFDNGAWVLQPPFERYLRKHGLLPSNT